MSEGSITCNEKLILLSSDIQFRLLIFLIATLIYTCRSLRASILRSRHPIMSCAHQNLPRRADAASTTSAVAISVDFNRISNKVLSFIKEGGRVGLRMVWK